MFSIFDPQIMPIIFAGLMGLSILIYVILDGYDLGIGMLMVKSSKKEKDVMISSIGPFWDANETWLVLAVGLLLVAFPAAHGVILGELYLPTALMLFGLIMRGVSFDFRAKAEDRYQHIWDQWFIAGSFLTSLTQGYMLGLYIVGFERSFVNVCFSLLVGVCLSASYCLVGSVWLILKTEGELQKKAINFAKIFLWLGVLEIFLISIATPFASARIFDKWFSMPNFLYLAPIPIFAGALFLYLNQLLKTLPRKNDQKCWLPFLLVMLIFVVGFAGLAYSFFPYIIPGSTTIWEAASFPQSLKIILVGTLVVLPTILIYTFFVHKIFWGKTTQLTYY
ncbi:MAG: cytochrome d ubiquinol oxidase subunit II [Rickettsiales bacterium]|jgi:cytochrome d ubiquinol oxidase subunit II